jgi:hypothetical protein
MLAAGQALGQSETATTSDPDQLEAAGDLDLLTQAELETLVAPVALYPDTLLIQILVAATQPLEVVKADRFLLTNADTDPEALKAGIEAEAWDPSVEVLAVGFPDVIGDMAQHIEWTETIGAAMEAQTDDVMAAVQTMRNQAINTGALISGEEQVVEVDSNENVVIAPTNPQVVYVPQYDPAVVYDNSATNALAGAAIGFGFFLLIDSIFDDDDDWNNYWGCRNCGGWGGGPIYRNPDIDIDIDGNVNIGNVIGSGNIGDGDGLRPGRPDGGWAPDPDRRDDARDKIAERRDPGGATTLPITREASSTDALRDRLSGASGAADIARPGVAATLPAVTRPGGGSSERLPQLDRPSARPADAKRDAIARTGATQDLGTSRPALSRPANAAKPAVRPAGVQRPSAIAKRSPGPKAQAASRRGAASAGALRTRR